MQYKEIKRRIANPGERCFHSRRYAICNEFGAIAFVHANHEQEAIDIAADAGKLDSELVSTEGFSRISGERMGRLSLDSRQC